MKNIKHVEKKLLILGVDYLVNAKYNAVSLLGFVIKKCTKLITHP
jgi:hypothetical protein